MGIKISNLPIIATPALTDFFPVVQSGVTYKETMTQLSSLFATSGANTNITSLTGITGVIQAPTFINDINGNHNLEFGSVASAVNYMVVYNSATGNPIQIQPAGSDTNIQFNIASKGTGQILLESQSPTAPVAIYSGTGFQHGTILTFANTSATRSVTFPDADGKITFTGTLVAGNVVKATNAFTLADAGFAVKANTTTAYGGGGTSNAFTATGLTTSSIVTATILTSTNAVAIAKAVPTADTLTVTFTADPGANTTVSWHAITPAV